MNFSDRLKELRIKRGYSQSELANKLKISKSTISMLEVGSRRPSFEMLELLGDFFNVDIDYLIGKEVGSTYYLRPETAELAKELNEREELKVLFDAVRDVSKEDVDFERRCIRIHQTRHRVGRKDTVQDTKTNKSKRTLALPSFLLDDIKKLIEVHHGYPFQTSDYLILTAFGVPMNPSLFSAKIRRMMDCATVHGLRHTFATMLNAEGFDIARISAELGHSNIHTTLVRYTHVFGGASESSKGIADAIDKKYATNLQQFTDAKESKKP